MKKALMFAGTMSAAAAILYAQHKFHASTPTEPSVPSEPETPAPASKIVFTMEEDELDAEIAVRLAKTMDWESNDLVGAFSSFIDTVKKAVEDECVESVPNKISLDYEIARRSVCTHIDIIRDSGLTEYGVKTGGFELPVEQICGILGLFSNLPTWAIKGVMLNIVRLWPAEKAAKMTEEVLSWIPLIDTEGKVNVFEYENVLNQLIWVFGEIAAAKENP